MKTSTKLLIAAGIVFGVLVFLVLVALVGLGFALEANLIPDTAAAEGSRLSSRAREQISEVVTLNEGETIEWFYSAGLFDFKEDGNIVTNQRLISYYMDADDGVPYVSYTNYDDVTGIETVMSESSHEDTIVTVRHADSELDYSLWFSAEDGRDKRIVAAIRARIE